MTTSQPNDSARRGSEDHEPDAETGVPADPQDPCVLEQFPDAANLPEPDVASRRMEGERDDTLRER